ncbi:MAG: hypothetical protein PHS17_00540 [Desulfobacterales bacterium]|nr:hypothetical protein [Desulfobacterales bacterium]
MGKDELPKKVTLVGSVVPGNWDNEGNVIGISFQVERERYVIELNEAGQELFDFLEEEVKVEGVCSTARNGIKRIRISSYEVLRDDDWADASEEDPGMDKEERG